MSLRRAVIALARTPGSAEREHAVRGVTRGRTVRYGDRAARARALHLIRPVFGQAYLWRDDDGITLVDTGIPGSEAAFAAAFDELGLPAPTCAAS